MLLQTVSSYDIGNHGKPCFFYFFFVPSGEGKKKKRKKPQAAANITAPQQADSDGIVNKPSTNGEPSTRDLSETTPHPTKLTAPQAVSDDPGEVPTPDLQHLQELLDSKRHSLLAQSHQTGKEEGAKPDGRAVLVYDDLDAPDVESLGAAAAGAGKAFTLPCCFCVGPARYCVFFRQWNSSFKSCLKAEQKQSCIKRGGLVLGECSLTWG